MIHGRPDQSGPDAGRGTTSGTVVYLHVARAKGDPMAEVPSVNLVARQGIEGDRNFGQGERRNVTLVQEEVLTEVSDAIGVTYRPGSSRRNITVRGIDLSALVGKEFRVGTARLHGHALCEPCDLMETSIGPGAREPLVHRAGIRAVVIEGGEVRPGDAVEAL